MRSSAQDVLWTALPTVALIVLIWLLGIRIIFVKPIGGLPDGGAALVYGAPGAWLIDSPDAACIRHQGGVSLLCRGIVMQGMIHPDRILLRLSYSATLHDMTVSIATRSYRP